MEDEKLIQLFWNRSETAIRETANKYGMVMAFTGLRLFHH